MQCKCITFKRKVRLQLSEIRHGFSKKNANTAKAYVARRHGIYIDATINRGNPKQLFAQGAPASTTTHATLRTQILIVA